MMETHSWELKEKKNRRKAIITVIVVHAALLILFLIMGLRSVYPPPTSGILINFGTMETGSTPEPSKVKEQPEEVSPAEEVTEPQVEQVEEVAQEEVVTQDIEEAPTIETSEETETTPEVETEPVEEITEPEPEIEEQVEEVEEPVEEQEPEPDPRAMFTGEESDEEEPSNEGLTYEPGDQGVETGDVSSDNYEGDVSMGKGDYDVGYDLGGRGLLFLPPIDKNEQETGDVVVRIKVDREGNVLFANHQLKGSTTNDPTLVRLAEEAARKAKFQNDPNAPAEQWGTITFKFKLK